MWGSILTLLEANEEVDLLRKALARIELLEGQLANKVTPEDANATGKPKNAKDDEDPPIVCPDGTAVLWHKYIGFAMNF